MHYHYHPQMPGDGLHAYCDCHIPEDEKWLTYVCDCERNQCVVCDEKEQVENPPTQESEKVENVGDGG